MTREVIRKYYNHHGKKLHGPKKVLLLIENSRINEMLEAFTALFYLNVQLHSTDSTFSVLLVFVMYLFVRFFRGSFL